ncbi:MAG: single-stranded-DNA-specific exonuclease RecJ [Pseudomonadales bacterium]|nr:single-stranded-DNA-specific exonuclease RecJ [Pseudomonadales bacterium]MCP5167619.1 single-stranded-DNA-specific exonuclease RecJ [Pseudomonadales bacterium]
MQKLIRRRPAPATRELAGASLHPLLAQIYSARGIRSARDLDLGLARLLPPAALHNAERAAVLLADAIAAGDRLLVVGDFDADGATSSALAVSCLRAFGAAEVDYLVPNRFEYGYGLTPEIVELAAARRPDLIITVDNGISSIEGVAAARALGIATLITDHHLAGRELPAADVIVNPNQPGCDFPSKNLAGVGVIFYVMLALRAELRLRGWFERRDEPNLAQYTDLVALGTVADVVPLDYNNRILVAAGLQRIRAGQARPGIQALLEVASRRPAAIVAADLGFAVGPRINAAGRLDDMSIGIECLLSQDPQRAMRLATQLQQLNQDRRVIESDMQQEALRALAELDLAREGEPPLAMTLYQPGWHQGVIGILASRIKDRLHRPTIAFADGDPGQIKGSARSIPGIHIRDILDAVACRHPGLISKFGGHAMAAGLSLARADYERFAEAFVAEVERHAEDVQLQAVIESDGELVESDFALELAEQLRLAGPWGQHFPEPVFDGRFQVVSQRLVAERHLKMVLFPASGSVLLDAIAFNIDPEVWPDQTVEQVQIAYRLDVNDYRGQRSLQLLVEHIEPASAI